MLVHYSSPDHTLNHPVKWWKTKKYSKKIVTESNNKSKERERDQRGLALQVAGSGPIAMTVACGLTACGSRWLLVSYGSQRQSRAGHPWPLVCACVCHRCVRRRLPSAAYSCALPCALPCPAFFFVSFCYYLVFIFWGRVFLALTFSGRERDKDLDRV